MRIIGIDASLTSTGVAIFEDGDQKTIVIQSDKTGAERLIEIRDRIRVFTYDADLITIEDYAFARANQAHQIGELGGVLRVMFYELRLNVLKVSPSAVKKFATGKGVASKEQMAVAVYKRWGKEFGTNDECDAFVLTEIGRIYHTYNLNTGEITTIPRYQQEVIYQLIDGKPKKKKTKNKTKDKES